MSGGRGYCQLCRLEMATVTVTDDNPSHGARVCVGCVDGRDWSAFVGAVFTYDKKKVSAS